MDALLSNELATKAKMPNVNVKIENEVKKESRNSSRLIITPAQLPTIKVKGEDPDNGKVDKSLPEADGSDMFEDVDEDEIVDLTYEGIAHVDGIRHFVCDSKGAVLLSSGLN
jgi:hypothetical protein